MGGGLGELETVLSYEDSLDKTSKKDSLTFIKWLRQVTEKTGVGQGRCRHLFCRDGCCFLTHLFGPCEQGVRVAHIIALSERIKS